MLNRLPIVGVMGSRRMDWCELSEPIGHGLASMKVHMLTGGGPGVMACASEAFSKVSPRHGLCIGIVPTNQQSDGSFEYQEKCPNPFLEIQITTPLPVRTNRRVPYSRNHVNIMSSDILVILPGGRGVTDEIKLSLFFNKRVCLLGPHNLSFDVSTIPHFNDPQTCLKWVSNNLS